MRKAIKILLVLFSLGAMAVFGGFWYMETRDTREPSMITFLDHCASCHSANGNGPNLLTQYNTDDSADELTNRILVQHSGLVKSAQLPEPMVKALALYVIEQRQELPSIINSHAHTIPEHVVESQHHDFKVELITEVGNFAGYLCAC